MVGDELVFTPVVELADLIKKKRVSPVDVTRETLERIDQLDPRFKAYITVLHDRALQEAKEAERAIIRGTYRGPFHGVPVAVKDLYWTKGVRTTGGSKVLAGWIPDQDATVVKRLKRAGAVLLGKLNLHEFAYGPTGENLFYGTPPNPWDRDRLPGGSSSGSAVSVATGLAFATLGSDTGGSIRIPAALCGIVGLKPTYGRVSRYGVLPLAWTMDHVGPMTRSVADCALMLQVLAGADRQDPTASRRPVPDYRRALGGRIKGVKIGVPQNHFFDLLDREVKEAVQKAIQVLEGLGVKVEPVSLPLMKHALGVSFVILAVEALAYHERYLRTRPQDYSPEIRQRLGQAQFVLGTHYVKAQRIRRLLCQEVEAVFRKVDALVTPTVPIPAPRIGEGFVTIEGTRQEARIALTSLTRPFNLTGHPVISVPCGFTTSGLPIGLQIVGRTFDEATLLKVAYAYELSTGWSKRRPPLN